MPGDHSALFFKPWRGQLVRDMTGSVPAASPVLRIPRLAGLLLGLAILAGRTDAATKWQNVVTYPSSRTWVGMGLDGTGNVYLNSFGSGVTGWNDYFTRRLEAATGVQAWEKVYGEKTYGGGQSSGFAVDAAGNSYVTGYDGKAGSGTKRPFHLTLQYLPDGKSGWIKKAGDPKNGGLFAATGPDGQVVLGGHIGGPPRGPQDVDINLVKYSTKGKLLWRQSLGEAPATDQYLYKLAIDPAGHVVILGSGTQGLIVAKFSGTDGRRLWTRVLPLGDNHLANVRDLATGADGSIALVGTTATRMIFGGNPRTVTLRLSGDDGSTTWERVRGVGWSAEVPGAVVIAADGRVITGGLTYDFSNALGRVTCHHPATGAILWEKVSGGGARPVAMTLNREGHVVVAGMVGDTGARLLRIDCHEILLGAPFHQETSDPGPGAWEIPSPDAVMLSPAGDLVMSASLNGSQVCKHAVFCYPPPPVPTSEMVFGSSTSWPPVPIPSGTPMDFGPRLAGSIGGEEQRITLANLGKGAHRGLKVELTGPDSGQFFIPLVPPDLFYPGSTMQLVVYFNPSQEPGPREATVRITGHGQGDEPYLIPLRGVSMSGPGYFEAWAAEHGVTTDAGATPHRDGVENLLKYAFNLDPGRADRRTMAPGGKAGLPLIRVIKEGGKHYLEAEFILRKDRGLNYLLKTSDRLDPGSFATTEGWSFEGSGEIDATWRRIKQRKAWDPAVHRRVFAVVEVTFAPP